MSEIRPIDANALKDEVRHQISKYNSGLDVFTTRRLLELIDRAPTIEPNKDYGAIQYSEGYNDGFMSAKELIIKEPERPKGEWIDYNNTFYKCPDCGYLLEKCCPQCQNKVVLPKGGAE